MSALLPKAEIGARDSLDCFRIVHSSRGLAVREKIPRGLILPMAAATFGWATSPSDSPAARPYRQTRTVLPEFEEGGVLLLLRR